MRKSRFSAQKWLKLAGKHEKTTFSIKKVEILAGASSKFNGRGLGLENLADFWPRAARKICLASFFPCPFYVAQGGSPPQQPILT